ncbi:MAG: hypothetical protein ACKVQC_00005, partial [Elusimicrobiota bacterium]
MNSFSDPNFSLFKLIQEDVKTTDIFDKQPIEYNRFSIQLNTDLVPKGNNIQEIEKICNLLSLALTIILSSDDRVKRHLLIQSEKKTLLVGDTYRSQIKASFRAILGNSKNISTASLDYYSNHPSELYHLFTNDFLLDTIKRLSNKIKDKAEMALIRHAGGQENHLLDFLKTYLENTYQYTSAINPEDRFKAQKTLEETFRQFAAAKAGPVKRFKRSNPNKEEGTWILAEKNPITKMNIKKTPFEIVSDEITPEEFIKKFRNSNTGKVYIYKNAIKQGTEDSATRTIWILAIRDGNPEMYHYSRTHSGIAGVNLFRQVHGILFFNGVKFDKNIWWIKDSVEMISFLPLEASLELNKLLTDNEIGILDGPEFDELLLSVIVQTGIAFDSKSQQFAKNPDPEGDKYVVTDIECDRTPPRILKNGFPHYGGKLLDQKIQSEEKPSDPVEVKPLELQVDKESASGGLSILVKLISFPLIRTFRRLPLIRRFYVGELSWEDYDRTWAPAIENILVFAAIDVMNLGFGMNFFEANKWAWVAFVSLHAIEYSVDRTRGRAPRRENTFWATIIALVAIFSASITPTALPAAVMMGIISTFTHYQINNRNNDVVLRMLLRIPPFMFIWNLVQYTAMAYRQVALTFILFITTNKDKKTTNLKIIFLAVLFIFFSTGTMLIVGITLYLLMFPKFLSQALDGIQILITDSILAGRLLHQLGRLNSSSPQRRAIAEQWYSQKLIDLRTQGVAQEILFQQFNRYNRSRFLNSSPASINANLQLVQTLFQQKVFMRPENVAGLLSTFILLVENGYLDGNSNEMINFFIEASLRLVISNPSQSQPAWKLVGKITERFPQTIFERLVEIADDGVFPEMRSIDQVGHIYSLFLLSTKNGMPEFLSEKKSDLFSPNEIWSSAAFIVNRNLQLETPNEEQITSALSLLEFLEHVGPHAIYQLNFETLIQNLYYQMTSSGEKNQQRILAVMGPIMDLYLNEPSPNYPAWGEEQLITIMALSFQHLQQLIEFRYLNDDAATDPLIDRLASTMEKTELLLAQRIGSPVFGEGLSDLVKLLRGPIYRKTSIRTHRHELLSADEAPAFLLAFQRIVQSLSSYNTKRTRGILFFQTHGIGYEILEQIPNSEDNELPMVPAAVPEPPYAPALLPIINFTFNKNITFDMDKIKILILNLKAQAIKNLRQMPFWLIISMITSLGINYLLSPVSSGAAIGLALTQGIVFVMAYRIITAWRFEAMDIQIGLATFLFSLGTLQGNYLIIIISILAWVYIVGILISEILKNESPSKNTREQDQILKIIRDYLNQGNNIDLISIQLNFLDSTSKNRLTKILLDLFSTQSNELGVTIESLSENQQLNALQLLTSILKENPDFLLDEELLPFIQEYAQKLTRTSAEAIRLLYDQLLGHIQNDQLSKNKNKELAAAITFIGEEHPYTKIEGLGLTRLRFLEHPSSLVRQAAWNALIKTLELQPYRQELQRYLKKVVADFFSNSTTLANRRGEKAEALVRLAKELFTSYPEELGNLAEINLPIVDHLQNIARKALATLKVRNENRANIALPLKTMWEIVNSEADILTDPKLIKETIEVLLPRALNLDRNPNNELAFAILAKLLSRHVNRLTSIGFLPKDPAAALFLIVEAYNLYREFRTLDMYTKGFSNLRIIITELQKEFELEHGFSVFGSNLNDLLDLFDQFPSISFDDPHDQLTEKQSALFVKASKAVNSHLTDNAKKLGRQISFELTRQGYRFLEKDEFTNKKEPFKLKSVFQLPKQLTSPKISSGGISTLIKFIFFPIIRAFRKLPLIRRFYVGELSSEDYDRTWAPAIENLLVF